MPRLASSYFFLIPLLLLALGFTNIKLGGRHDNHENQVSIAQILL